MERWKKLIDEMINVETDTYEGAKNMELGMSMTLMELGMIDLDQSRQLGEYVDLKYGK